MRSSVRENLHCHRPCAAAGTEEAVGAHNQAVRALAHLMHSHLVEFLRDHLRRPELQARASPGCKNSCQC